MLNLVFLPATEPDEKAYGAVPERIEAYPEARIHPIRFPTMVWYNESVRRETVTQIRALGVPSVIVLGFSKSGLGAWNIARDIPDLVSGTLLFDSPVVRDERPGDACRYYETDAAWQADQPIRTMDDFGGKVSERHRLVLISGASFHGEMCTLAEALSKTAIAHVFLPRPHMRHHWQAGWVEQGLRALLEPNGEKTLWRH